MRQLQALALLAVGALVGWLACTLAPGLQAFPSGSILTAATTLIVALWIQRIIRFRTELDKVPFDFIGRLVDRVDSLLGEIMKAAKPVLDESEKQQIVGLLRSLGNEVSDFAPIVRALDTANAEFNDLQSALRSLKRHLTDEPRVEPEKRDANRIREVQLEPAMRDARRMRSLNLALRWKLCQKILERPDCFQKVIDAAGKTTIR